MCCWGREGPCPRTLILTASRQEEGLAEEAKRMDGGASGASHLQTGPGPRGGSAA